MRTALILILFVPLCRLASAQEVTHEFEVSRIVFEGNKTFDENDLRSIMQTRETPGWFWKTMYKVSEKIGEKAEYFDPVAFETDVLLLKKYYKEHGFLHASLDTSLQLITENKRATIIFRIHEGVRSLIDTLQFVGLSDLPGDLLRELEDKRLVKVGDPFVTQTVSDEVRRTTAAFFDYGYANVHVKTPEALVYTSTNNVTLVFTFAPGLRYRFGQIQIQQDSTVTERVDQEVILRHLDFGEGDYYSEGKKIDSERNLSRLGVFERVQIGHLLSQLPDSSVDLPTRVFVRPRSLHELSPEIGVNDEKNAFNIQLGVGYNNRNFLGGARNLTTQLRLSVQSIQDVNFQRVFSGTGLKDTTVISTAELSTQMIQPFFITNKVSLIWTISARVEKEKLFFIPILLNRIGFNWQQATYTKIFIDWNLERVSFSSVVPNIDSSIIKALTIDRTPQFNSIITFTMQRDKRNDIFSPSGGFFHSGTIEESGFLPSFSGSLFGSELPYSRYLKLSAVGQWYWDPAKEQKLILAFRAKAGVAELYGSSPAPVPFPHRFFAGGSGSVRGWRARVLGAFSRPDLGGTALFETNLEARWHLFKNAGRLWFLELPKLSLVFFYDAGNVWSELKQVRATEIAMAAGFGIRFDTIAGPLRIDFGFRTYDPFEQAGRRWITEKRFFPETFSGGVLHFGVGHAF